MPYLFKLSQRVARSRTRALLVGAAAFFAACETGDLSSVNVPTHPSFATTTGAPAQVTDLAAAAMTDTSATLTFTEVDAKTDTTPTLRFTEVTDGDGQPASYDIRGVAGSTLSWGATAPSVTRGTCATPVTGTAIGTMRSCTVLGLTASTTYSFQLVAFRGTLRVNAVFGNLSDIASGATAAAASVPVASVAVT